MYHPSEDSELLARVLEVTIRREGPASFLDMGCGTGIQSKTAISCGVKKESIIAADIDEESVEETAKLGVRALKSDLFENIHQKFDLIAFNPPYLPEDKHDKGKDTSGGREGHETIARFLNQAKSHLTQEGIIILLFSSLSGKNRISEIMEKEGFSFKELARAKFFMEEIYVFKLKLS